MLSLIMSLKPQLLKKIREFSSATPDPARAERNLVSLLSALAEEHERAFFLHLKEIALLFAYSQFLANYAANNHQDFFEVLEQIRDPLMIKHLKADVGRLPSPESAELPAFMKELRLFKKRHLVRLTLRDILGETDIRGSMDELTMLAQVVINQALSWSLSINKKRFGELPPDSKIALIALGKLGGEELNYSSDVDLMAVYRGDGGETSGILSPSGVRMHRISEHEFYSKVMELFTKILSSNTEEGIAYRVDMRLRPQGQKGDIALLLASYKNYYEAWGRTWERMVLIRARPVAGDIALGHDFMKVISPFVWKEALDFSDIDEIRALKKKIDSLFARDDIKRGYGGLREAEFFIQTFQLLYGPSQKPLRTHRLFNAIQALRWEGLVPERDLVTLWENYLYLRRLEHYLQMEGDLQTHTLPSSEEGLIVLGKKMGFADKEKFLSDLRLRRMRTKSMYNGLLGTEEDASAEALSILEGELTEEEMRAYLSFRGIREIEKGLSGLCGIRERVTSFTTSGSRALMRKIIPGLLEKALAAESPDRALPALERFVNTIGTGEAVLTGLMEQKTLGERMIKMFSLSPYLTRIFLSGTLYFGLLVEGTGVIKKSLEKTEAEIRKFASDSNPAALGDYRRSEEIRLGMLFLANVMEAGELSRYLSHLAEAVIRNICACFSPLSGFAVIAMGKLGGREITYGSDLDLIFVSQGASGMKRAEQIIKKLSAYTEKGILYNVDTRLRPDGTKGVLVKSLEGYREYYMGHAQGWEVQALLKAKPVAGDCGTAKNFMQMAKEIIKERGPLIREKDIRDMRERIFRELSPESPERKARKELDIKFGRGGLEDIEFRVQGLQLLNAADPRPLIVQNTLAALDRLVKAGHIAYEEKKILKESYSYMRRLFAFQRLNDNAPLSAGGEIDRLAAIFMGHRDREEFLGNVERLRAEVLKIINRPEGA
jgi:glutamate-ammonia-ligase adenylyltransferase